MIGRLAVRRNLLYIRGNPDDLIAFRFFEDPAG
jgi:hypothetical protein